MADPIQTLQAQWLALHQDMQRSETKALAIKLLALALLVLGPVLALSFYTLIAGLAILWLQDGIVMTVASRTEERLLVLEKAIQEQDVQIVPDGFYSAWQAHRPGTLGLLRQYARQALRPTVAFPHVVLIALLCVQHYG